MDESYLENGREDRENHFWRKLKEDIVDVDENISMLPVRAGSLLRSTFVRFTGKYGLYISHGPPKQMDTLSEDIEEYLSFLEELNENKRRWVVPFLVEGGMLFLYEDWNEVNRHYEQIPRQGVGGNPFFAQTIEDTGTIIKSNT